MTNVDLSLEGRVALITGAGRGIGLAIARALAGAGCAVAIQDVDIEVARREVEAMTKAGQKAIALGGDVTSRALPAKLVRDTVKRLGGMHVLVNNASIQSRQPWTELDLREFDRTFYANVGAPLRLCQEVEPIFRRQRWGRIVNIGSIQQRKGNEHMLAYAMSKAALDNMTIALARDLAKHGVTVNNLAPGYFRTLRNPQLQSAEGRKKAADWMPAGRVGEPQDAAGLALLLCSPAGAYITGQTIFVDGGMGIR